MGGVPARSRLLTAVLAAVAGVATAGSWPPGSDLEEALSQLGVSAGEVRVGAPRDWIGSPDPTAAPFLAPHVPEVMARPLRLVELGSTLTAAADLAAREGLSGGPLLGPVTVFALQPRLPDFRGFRHATAPVSPTPGLVTAALASAATHPHWGDLVDLHRPWVTASGTEPGELELGLPPGLRDPVGVLLEACLRSAAWVELSWRGVDAATVEAATADPDLTRSLASGERWWPALARAAEDGDDQARAFATVLLAAAIEAVLPSLEAAAADSSTAGLQWQAPTALGRVVVLGTDSDHLRCDHDCLLVIDLGGDDTYTGTIAAAAWPRQAVAVAIDLDGNDDYRQLEAPLAQGSGVGGVGLLVDRRGRDTYHGGSRCQGHGLLGYGILWDGAGDDRYTADAAAQGSAVFGSGLLYDQGGDDGYHLDGEGQGFAGPGAVGALLDTAGDDRYRAEADPAMAGRADPHSDGRVAANNAQGAGVGRRGDLGNGHAWAGGVGLLVDASGRDDYRCGNFCQGLGYWYGTGLLLDGGGDDVYRSVYFSQGAALHQGAALLLDRDGGDVHWLEDNAAASLGYAWDFALAVFVDGGGDDLYRLRGTGLGAAQRRSVGLFLDLAGCDTYRVLRPAVSLGFVDAPPPHPPGLVAAPTRAAQAGLFLDLGGSDLFERGASRAPVPRVQTSPWFLDRTELDWAPLNLGAGLDLPGPGPTLDDLLSQRRRAE